MTELKRVRTGPTSYLKLNAEDYKAWKAAGNVEYGGETLADPDADAESKAMDKPAENKAMAAPAEKKSGNVVSSTRKKSDG